MKKVIQRFLFILVIFIVSALIALPKTIPLDITYKDRKIQKIINIPTISFNVLKKTVSNDLELKQGLDIQGGMQVVLNADMTEVDAGNRDSALESAQEIIRRRVDMFGVSEPLVQTSVFNDQYRILVELPGMKNPDLAVQLIGKTAELDFRIQQPTEDPEATMSPTLYFQNFKETGLKGEHLELAAMQYNTQTGEPIVSIKFNNEGREIFADITKNNRGKSLGIFIDNMPITAPRINDPILDGAASISGGFTEEAAEQLAIQLNAGALPVPIQVVEQRVVGATLGNQAILKSLNAGLIGLLFVAIFMLLNYGKQGLVANLALIIYAAISIAIYKIIGVTLTLPGIAGLLLSIGMAVDSNILIFERIREERRSGLETEKAMEKGFGKAWDNIKDANIVTIIASLILINPLNFGFLNSSGLVRGFGITLLIGVLVSMFTGVVVTRTLMRLAYKLFAKKGVDVK